MWCWFYIHVVIMVKKMLSGKNPEGVLLAIGMLA